jgi:hypothetical protein
MVRSVVNPAPTHGVGEKLGVIDEWGERDERAAQTQTVENW